MRVLVGIPMLLLLSALVINFYTIELTLQALGPTSLSWTQILAVDKVRLGLIGLGSVLALGLGLLFSTTITEPLGSMVRRARARLKALSPNGLGTPPINELADLSYAVDHALRACEKFTVDARLLEAMPVGVLLVDGQGRVKRANAEARRLLQSPGSNVEGRALTELAPPEVGEALAQAVRQVREGGAAVQLPSLFMSELGGAGVELNVMVTPIASERRGEILVTVTDLTRLPQSR